MHNKDKSKINTSIFFQNKKASGKIRSSELCPETYEDPGDAGGRCDL